MFYVAGWYYRNWILSCFHIQWGFFVFYSESYNLLVMKVSSTTRSSPSLFRPPFNHKTATQKFVLFQHLPRRLNNIYMCVFELVLMQSLSKQSYRNTRNRKQFYFFPRLKLTTLYIFVQLLYLEWEFIFCNIGRF